LAVVIPQPQRLQRQRTTNDPAQRDGHIEYVVIARRRHGATPGMSHRRSGRGRGRFPRHVPRPWRRRSSRGWGLPRRKGRGCGCLPLDRPPRQSGHRLSAVRDRQRTCPKRRANPGGGDDRLPEARRDHGQQVGKLPPTTARRRALVAVSTMIGALTLSRVVTDPKLSAEILKEAEMSLVVG